jgi:hypothetical protein
MVISYGVLVGGLGMSSSQLTNSYFSEGSGSTTNQITFLSFFWVTIDVVSGTWSIQPFFYGKPDGDFRLVWSQHGWM